METRYLYTRLAGIWGVGGPSVFPNQYPFTIALGLRVFLKDF